MLKLKNKTDFIHLHFYNISKSDPDDNLIINRQEIKYFFRVSDGKSTKIMLAQGREFNVKETVQQIEYLLK